ncbi:MAG TPA: HAMP domain-containing histidine kinase [bacterium]|nr:HAMP domain-containing histidine kinase [bacterium]
MQILSKIDSSEYIDLNKVIEWFIRLRWIACFGVFIALITANFKLYLNLPYLILFILNGLLFGINLLFTVYFSFMKQRNLSRREMSIFFHVQVCCDYSILFFLVYFTGFFENLFSYYFVFHIILTSFIFSSSVVFIYVTVLFAFFGGILLAEYYNIIPHFSLSIVNNSSYGGLIFLRAFGLCSTLIISAYLITSIKNRIEEKGKRVEVELNHYKSLDKIKSNFILQVTHELRGPIAALMGYHEMIMRGITGKINKKTEEVIFKANRRTGNLLNMIDEMLDYAYMKSEDESHYSKKRIGIKSLIDYNLDLFFTQAEQKNITFSSNCSKDLMVLADRDLLNIIFHSF